MNHRNRFSALAAIALFLLLTGCAPQESEGPKRLVLANVHIDGYPTASALQGLAHQIAEDPYLSARLEVDLQLGGVLGNEKETLEKLAFGGIQLACVSAAPLAEFSDAIGVLTLPYLFADADEMWQTLEGSIGDELLSSLEDAGLVGLAWYDAGARSFYNRDRLIESLADLQGLKIRVQKSEIMRATVAALGASPVALGFKEVYTSLSTGNIDGAENNLPSFLSERHFEAAKYYSYDRHTMIPDLVVMHKGTWDSMTPEDQSALREIAQQSAENQRQLWAAYVEEARETLVAEGVSFSEITDLTAFQSAVDPVYTKHAPQYADWIERIRNP